MCDVHFSRATLTLTSKPTEKHTMEPFTLLALGLGSFAAYEVWQKKKAMKEAPLSQPHPLPPPFLAEAGQLYGAQVIVRPANALTYDMLGQYLSSPGMDLSVQAMQQQKNADKNVSVWSVNFIPTKDVTLNSTNSLEWFSVTAAPVAKVPVAPPAPQVSGMNPKDIPYVGTRFGTKFGTKFGGGIRKNGGMPGC